MKILTLLILSGMLITPSQITKAEQIYNVSESDLIKLLEKYKDEEVVLEDGLVLTIGEAVDLPITEGWTIYNENVAEIVNGELVAKSVGSTFASQQTDDTVYILEVCITEAGIATASYSRAGTNVDRDYYKVFIDPGHGGYDNGAVQNGVLEDELNLQISKKVEAKLKAKGVQVQMSRYDDTYLSLTDRTKMANNVGSDVFVSIHQNSATSSSAMGIESYYYSPRQDSKSLTTEIQNDLIAATNGTNRGVKTANFAVIKTSNMSSSLVECGFISNATEAKNLSSSSYQDKVADGIVNGIMDYLKANIILNNAGSTDSGNSNSGSTGATTTQSGTIKVSTSLNVRSGAGTSYSSIGSLSNGAKVEIVETSGSWYKIKYGSGYGYVSKDYVTVTSNSTNNSGSTDSGNSNSGSTGATTTQSGTIKVSTSLNVRSGAGTSYSSIGSLSNGAKVEIVETSGSWYKIKYGSGYGYVSKDYVTVSSSTTDNSGSTNNGSTDSGNSNSGSTGTTTTQSGTIKVSTSLNVRSGAGTSYSSIGSLSNGAKVEIVETNGSWYKIKYGSGYGYVSKDYVTVSSSSNDTTPPTTTTTKTGVVNVTTSLNVRGGAGTSYSSIGSLSKNSTVEIVETVNSWYKIKYSNGYGYVSKDYIVLKDKSIAENNVIKEGTAVTLALKVREDSNYDASIIGTMAMGEKVSVLEESGEWSKVNYNNTIGYILNEYVDFNIV